MVTRLKLEDAQNRLGFLLRLVFETQKERRGFFRLKEVLDCIERARLARDGTLCQDSMSEAERAWLHENRSEAARHWNLLTDLRPDHLPYV